MAVSDPIADMLTKIRNAYMAQHEQLVVKNSKINQEIVRVMQLEGYIESYEIDNSQSIKTMTITLKYDESMKPVVHEIKKISKPGRRIYSKYRNIQRVRNGFGTVIISTSKGVLTDKQAREMKVGGELICSIW